MAASRNPSQLARALRELGRLERTLFMIEWYSDSALRRRCQAGLHKGDATHKMKRAADLPRRQARTIQSNVLKHVSPLS
nr:MULTISPECIES: Tn3 family transposase [unclassified Microvirga]